MEKNIEYVAIYLRKSRGDEGEDVLSKHRNQLTEYAEHMGWDYKIYEEGIASGDSLDTRSVMLELLNEIENDTFDGVLVVDYDRLSRGSIKDRGRINEAFKDNDILIITPQRVYDLNDDTDDTVIEMFGFTSRFEYKQIKKRMLEGKKAGAKDGKWVNGKPPYPYEYNPLTQTVEVNKDKAEIYRMVVDTYLQGEKGTEAIAFELNKKGIPSPAGAKWSSNAIQRLLLHEFHMGIVIYGRNKWVKKDGKKVFKEQRAEADWSKGEGKHERLKTHEEHERIIEISQRRNKIPRKSRAGTFPTSGLMYCKKCEHRMLYSVGRVEAKSGIQFNYTKCGHKDEVGIKCPQQGIKLTDEFYKAIYDNVVNKYLNEEHLERIEKNKQELKEHKASLKIKSKQLKENEEALMRLTIQYEKGILPENILEQRVKGRRAEIDKLQREIRQLEGESEATRVYDKDELKRRIEDFKQNWRNTTSPKEQNLLLRSIVKRIIYDRDGDRVSINIELL